MGKRSARREEARRKLNLIKVTIAIFLVFFTVMTVWLITINNDNGDKEVSEIPSNQIDFLDESYEEEFAFPADRHAADTGADAGFRLSCAGCGGRGHCGDQAPLQPSRRRL